MILVRRCWRLISPLNKCQRGLRWTSRRTLMTLAIETSCDDTAVAVLDKQNLPCGGVQARLLFNERITSKNTGKGGIHPVEALESHEANLATLISRAVKSLPSRGTNASVCTSKRFNSDSERRLPDLISVTRGPGMRSNLACGLNTAKGLAVAYQIPLIGVHHMQAHALTPRLEQALSVSSNDIQPAFPFLTLLVSGGHSMLLHSKSLIDHETLVTTRDIAIGDALDKCGRLILPNETKAQAADTAFARYLSDYAFPTPATFADWPVPRTREQEIEKLDNKFGWKLKTPLSETKDLAFSFSGFSSSIERTFLQRMVAGGGAMSEEERLLFGRAALGTAFEHLISRTLVALQMLEKSGQHISTLVVSGGVAANSFLRYFMRQSLDLRGFEHIQILFPRPEFCTDNAAMIAWAGLEMFEAGYSSHLDVSAVRKWSMDPKSDGGGILGVPGWRLGHSVE